MESVSMQSINYVNINMANYKGFSRFFSSALLLLLAGIAGVSSIGVNYGRVGNNLPSPAEVVSLLHANGIKQTKIFDADPNVLNAFSYSGISVIICVTNQELQYVASTQANADNWVKQKVTPYATSGRVTIPYIAVGNEVGYSSPYVVEAMRKLHNALQSAGLGSIKVSTPVAFDMMGNSYPPSAGRFQGGIEGQMRSILSFIQQTGSKFMINIYPFFAYMGNPGQIDIAYATFGNAPGVNDQGRHYSNLFDAQFDAVVAAIEGLGFKNLPIMVTESGWPSQGNFAATIDNARNYNSNLVKHVLNGSPRRPGPIETYIFALFNENQKNPEYEKNFGLFYPNKQKVYPINLSSSSLIASEAEEKMSEEFKAQE